MTPPGSSLPTAAALFERTVVVHGDEVALDDGTVRVTYRDLDARANQLARHLLATGVVAEQIVGVALPRSVDCIATLLAVLKAGGAYLPLDLRYPTPRLALMLGEARPVCTVTTSAGLRRLAAVVDETATVVMDDPATAAVVASRDPRPLTDADRVLPARAAHPMYVIYTSGSTGAPKGVVVTGTGMAALARTQRRLGVGPGDRVLQFVSISFDAAFWDISTALFSGATLVLVPGEASTPDADLHDLITDGGITLATLPPAVLATLDDAVLEGATIVTTGDTCSKALARRWGRAGRRLVNGYGPTETTVGATLSIPYAGGEVPIGHPFEDTAVHLLDSDLRPVDDGDVGEIYVGGPGLARGYLNRPELTATRFVADPFGDGGRLYRTGDLGSRGIDGQFVFHGRADDQVKIRGFRVEPAEVEAVLCDHPQVRQAVVLVHDDEHRGKHLVAHVVADCPVAELRAHLAERVPDHLVPAAIRTLTALPVTPQGKVDRAALLSPASLASASDGPAAVGRGVDTDTVDAEPSGADGPGTDEERWVVATVADLLGLDEVSAADDFFDVGGHSLLAARLIGAIRTELGIRLPVRTFYEDSRICGIAASIARVGSTTGGRGSKGSTAGAPRS